MEIIVGDSVEDINLRWSGCYGKLGERLFNLRSVRSYTEDAIVCQYKVEEGGRWKYYDSSTIPLKDIDMSFAPLRNVDIGMFSVSVRQSHERSYRLGLCDARVYSSVISADIASKLRKPTSFNLDVLYPRLVAGKYHSIEQSVDEIMSRKAISRAVDADYSIGVSDRAKLLGLYRGPRLIGELNPSTLEVLLPYKHRYFIEELQERGHEVILGDK